MSHRNVDSKREEFRKYLESSGVMDTFTRIITMIYENDEKPADPLQFVRDQLVKHSPVTMELQLTQKYLDSAKERIAELQTENEKLKKEVESYKAKLLTSRNSTKE